MMRGKGIIVGVSYVLLGVCGATSARACTIDADCDDGIFCTLDRCFFGTCVNSFNDGQCNDGLFCTGTEFCDVQADACASGPPPTCAPGLFCSAVFDNCVQCDTNADCDDGLFCNGVEVCNLGLCGAGSPVDCSFLNTECITGLCDEVMDVCVQGAPCDDGNLCTDDICTVGVGCTNPLNYQVGVVCCDPATGGTTVIDDGDACTSDVCNAITGSVTHPVMSCNDGNACTINDVCINNGAGCAGTDVNTLTCSGDADCPLGTCDTALGRCDCMACTSAAQCNDGIACTLDECTNSVCVHTADDAVCASGLFCAQQVCDRAIGCILTPFCTPLDGNPCPDPATCNETADDCGGCAPPSVAVTSRYLSITPPAAGSIQMALMVRGDCADGAVSCVGKYVDFDSPVDPGDPTVGRLIATPVFRTAAAWGTVDVRGAEILPNTVYRIHAECNPGGVQSAGVAVTTWVYGDTDGSGRTNFTDISRVVVGFQGGFSGSLTREETDLIGTSCPPNRTINFQDITDDVNAFQANSSTCPAPCP